MKKVLKIFLTAALALSVYFSSSLTVSAAGTSAKACVVMEAGSGRILYSKNPDERLPEASTTKIMTALVVAENADADTVVRVPEQAQGVEGSSVYLRAGEHLTVKELLYGLMLQSGNDCAVALALTVGGSIENFAAMMNDKAAALGCGNTNFVNPHGLPDDNHYTSARDLAVISAAAMNNPLVKEIVSTKKINISNEGYGYDRVIVNKNKILSSFEGANGVKTGYTKKAGRCFVGAAERNGMQLISVVLNCGPMFEESMSLMDEMFDKYEMKNLAEGVAIPKCVAVKKGRSGSVKVACEREMRFPLKKDGSENGKIRRTLSMTDVLKAPVGKGDKAGELKVSFDNRLIFSSNIVTLNKIEKAGIFSRLFGSEKNSNDKTQ